MGRDRSTPRRPELALAGDLRQADGARLEATYRGAVTHIGVRGELDLGSVAELEALLAGAPLRPGAAVVVDLAACRFIDSSVIAALLRAHARARACDAGLTVVVAPVGAVRRTLEIAAVCETLAVVDDGSDGERVPVRQPRRLWAVPSESQPE